MNLLTPTWDAEVDAHAGAILSPLHLHHANEELLLVLSGTPALRAADGAERELAAGDVVSFLAGPDGVHHVVNRSGAPDRVLIRATNDLPEVADQSENGALAIITAEGLRVVVSALIAAAQPETR